MRGKGSSINILLQYKTISHAPQEICISFLFDDDIFVMNQWNKVFEILHTYTFFKFTNKKIAVSYYQQKNAEALSGEFTVAEICSADLTTSTFYTLSCEYYWLNINLYY
jgi:hypothetical protein